MFIFWGTKVRTRALGVRAEYCNGCLRVCQHEVLAIEHASHVYYIHCRWRAQASYRECVICSALDQVAESAMMVDKESPSTQSIESLVAATNPDLPRVYGDIARIVEKNIPESERDKHILNRFCARSNEEFKRAEHDLGGLPGIVLILFLIAAGVTFAAAETTIGVIVSIALCIALIWIRSWAIHRRVSQRVRPRLSSMLMATGIKWEQLKSDLASGTLKYSRLRRHFSRSAYGVMYFGNGSDSDMQRRDFLVPTVDMSSLTQPLETAVPVEERYAEFLALREKLGMGPVDDVLGTKQRIDTLSFSSQTAAVTLDLGSTSLQNVHTNRFGACKLSRVRGG